MQNLRREAFLSDKNSVMTESDYAESLKAGIDTENSVRGTWIQLHSLNRRN